MVIIHHSKGDILCSLDLVIFVMGYISLSLITPSRYSVYKPATQAGKEVEGRDVVIEMVERF